jgi:trehalose 6-phosphate synthase
MRAPLITAALNADVIGFFARRWVTNFLDCVRDMVPDARIDRENSLVHRAGRVTEVRTMPLGYSPRGLAARAASLPAELADWVGDAALVVHSGRTDPIKNAGRAIDIFAATAGGSAGARLAVKMNPNRLYVPANQQYLDEARRRAGQANQKLGYEAVRVLVTNDVGITLGLLRRADVLFLNSVIDGMNLTAFEGAMVNERSCALILSENCGAAEVLGDVSTIVCPFDVDEQRHALWAALDAPPGARAESFARLRDTASHYTLERWVDQQWQSLSGERDG